MNSAEPLPSDVMEKREIQWACALCRSAPTFRYVR
jgi:hypothetical protein